MDFYTEHGAEFSKSRFRIWPQVRKHLESYAPDSNILDIGCGNGKYFKVRSDISMTGVEPSVILAEICRARGYPVVHGNAHNLPFQDATFDGAIMIAVLHHIPPEEQCAAMLELQRILKPGATAFLTAWATEQPAGARRSFVKGLNLVRWRGKDSTPIPYWVMDESAAREFVAQLPGGLVCTHMFLNAGNWNFALDRR